MNLVPVHNLYYQLSKFSTLKRWKYKELGDSFYLVLFFVRDKCFSNPIISTSFFFFFPNGSAFHLDLV